MKPIALALLLLAGCSSPASQPADPNQNIKAWGALPLSESATTLTPAVRVCATSHYALVTSPHDPALASVTRTLCGRARREAQRPCLAYVSFAAGLGKMMEVPSTEDISGAQDLADKAFRKCLKG